MTDLPPVRRLLSEDPARQADDVCVLTHDERLLRRKRLITVQGAGFLVDLPKVTNLDHHWGFELEDGSCIRIVPAAEEVLVVTGPDLARYAWHIGNRHTPCRIEPERLVIRADHVLTAMLRGLGAELVAQVQPFIAEPGAYGTGRPMGHAHAADAAHEHSHDHTHHHRHD